jgi:hypothetical protein
MGIMAGTMADIRLAKPQRRSIMRRQLQIHKQHQPYSLPQNSQLSLQLVRTLTVPLLDSIYMMALPIADMHMKMVFVMGIAVRFAPGGAVLF